MLVELMKMFVSGVFQMYTRIKTVSHTYANFVEVPVPLKEDEEEDPGTQKVCSSSVSCTRTPSTVFSSLFTQVDIFKSAYGQIPTKLLRMEERNVYCGTYFTTVLLNR